MHLGMHHDVTKVTQAPADQELDAEQPALSQLYGDSTVMGSAVMEPCNRFGAATAMQMLCQHASMLCAHSSNISAKSKLVLLTGKFHNFTHLGAISLLPVQYTHF